MLVFHVRPVPTRSAPAAQLAELARRGHTVRAWTHSAAALAGLVRDAVVLVDAYAGVEEAERFCRDLTRVRTDAALVVAVRAKQLGTLGADWPVDDFVLPESSGPEWERRLALSRERHRRSGGGHLQRLGDLTLDGDTYSLHAPGRTIALTGTEYRVLHLFFSNPEAVLAREVIRARGWGDTSAVGRTVDTFVCRLRHKLGPVGESLDTVRGVGYRFVPPAVAADRAA